MMNFPSNPSANQVFTNDIGTSWRWNPDISAWELIGVSTSFSLSLEEQFENVLIQDINGDKFKPIKIKYSEDTNFEYYKFGWIRDINNLSTEFSETGAITNWNPILLQNLQTAYIFAVADDTENIYISTESDQLIRKISKLDLTVSAISLVPYGGYIYTIAVDNDFVYIAGETSNTIKKYNKSNLSYVSESPSYGGDVFKIDVDSDYIYAVGDITNRIRKYSKSDMQFVSETPVPSGEIYTLTMDNDFIYAGGYEGSNQTKIYKYSKSNMQLIASSTPRPGINYIYEMLAFDNDVYTFGEYQESSGGLSITFPYVSLAKYNKSDLSIIATTSIIGDVFGFYALAVNSGYLYAGIDSGFNDSLNRIKISNFVVTETIQNIRANKILFYGSNMLLPFSSYNDSGIKRYTDNFFNITEIRQPK